MKFAKATQKDVDAATDAMSILNDISRGNYPTSPNEEEDPPYFFDPDDSEHLRKFYDTLNATLDKSPGWANRVIGGMCYVILYDKNKIVDPDADTLEIHPRFSDVAAQRDELAEVLRAIVDDGIHCDVVPHLFARAKAALAKTGSAA